MSEPVAIRQHCSSKASNPLLPFRYQFHAITYGAITTRPGQLGSHQERQLRFGYAVNIRSSHLLNISAGNVVAYNRESGDGVTVNENTTFARIAPE